MTTNATLTPDARFALLVAAFGSHSNVTLPEVTRGIKRFGAESLKVHNKIFAMLVDG